MSALACDFTALAVPGVRALQPYQPGKPESELQREYGLSDIIKLASNENPLGPSPKVLAAIQEQLPELARYPDGNGFELKTALAQKHAVDPACITLGNGSNDVLELISRAFLNHETDCIFSQHAFAVYPLATQATGATAQVAAANTADHVMPYGHNLPAFKALLTERTRVVFVANPNNPTGTWNTSRELQDFLHNIPEQVLVVVDEAYFDYVDRPDYQTAIGWLQDYPNLIVTRTFSKAYGLAGLRVGYALSHPQVADLLNRVRQPFNVNSLSLAAAQTALADREYIATSQALNNSGIAYLQVELSRLGLHCLPSVANFLCVQLPRPGMEIFQALLPKGIIVRPVANYGLPDFIRITIGTETENQRLVAALSEVL